MKSIFATTPTRLAVLALATSLASCSTVEGWFSGDKVDYRSTTNKPQALDVPPDLTQLARESRYQPQGGVVSASGSAAAPIAGTAAAAGAATVALNSQGAMRVERQGQQRWLVVPQSPDQVWPQVKSFWDSRGFTLASENAAAGVMETNWAENRTKLSNDIIRNTIGKFLPSLFDSGERDMYRTRIERTATGSEIYVTHRGAEEIYVGERRDSTAWRPRPNDPQLEAEILSRLMIALGSKDEPARAAVATAADAPSKVSAAPAVVTGTATSLTVEESFDRAWRRVGLALDRGGFTVEDRDRAAGLYYVRYVDPKSVGKDEPSWWSKLWGDGKNPQAAVRLRIALKPSGDSKTLLSVQNATGAPETGENAQRIVSLLTNELR